MQTNQNAPVAPTAQRAEEVVVLPGSGAPVTVAIPQSQAQVEAIVGRVRGIESQIRQLGETRTELVEQIRQAPEGVARTGLEERVKLIDQQIASLDAQLASANLAATSAPPDLVRIAEHQVYRSGDNGFEGGFFVGAFTVFVPILLLYGWRRFRRKRRPAVTASELPSAANSRFDQLERGMEAIAIEVERISEGQRFVTRLLAEKNRDEVNAVSAVGEADSLR